MRIKSLFYIIIALLIISCSGYFNPESTKKVDSSINTLKISGSSANLSSDTADDICPFLFRDSSTGNVYLFFSSNRDVSGKYKIYYAKMESDETFQSPVIMNSTVNTTGNNIISPVLFRIGGNLYIAAISYSGATTNIKTYQLDSSFNVITTVVSPAISDARSISSFLAYDYNALFVCNGTPNVAVYTNSPAGAWLLIETKSIQSNVDSLTGMGVIDFISGKADSYFLLGLSTQQFSGMAYHADFVYSNNQINTNTASIYTNFFSIPQYRSSYQDITPYVDVKVGLSDSKVYFSSKREGTFDLYRYNKQTFDQVIH